MGINNRNLHSFQLDMGTTSRLAAVAKARGSSAMLASLSGVGGRGDVERLTREDGVQCVLVGEALMRAADPARAVAELRGDALAVREGDAVKRPLAKVCGVTTAADALLAARGGADLIGVIFAEKSKRRVDAREAKAIVDAVRGFGERTERWTPPSRDAQHSHVEQLAAHGQALRR